MVASTPDGSFAMTVLLKCGWAIAAAAASSVSATDAVKALFMTFLLSPWWESSVYLRGGTPASPRAAGAPPLKPPVERRRSNEELRHSRWSAKSLVEREIYDIG